MCNNPYKIKYYFLFTFFCFGGMFNLSCREDRHLEMRINEPMVVPFEYIPIYISGYDTKALYDFSVRLNGEDTKLCYFQESNQWAIQIPEIEAGTYTLELWTDRKKPLSAESLEVLPSPIEGEWLADGWGKIIGCNQKVFSRNSSWNDPYAGIIVQTYNDEPVSLFFTYEVESQKLYETASIDPLGNILACFSCEEGDTLKTSPSSDWWTVVTYKSSSKMVFTNKLGVSKTFRRNLGCIDCDW